MRLLHYVHLELYFLVLYREVRAVYQRVVEYLVELYALGIELALFQAGGFPLALAHGELVHAVERLALFVAQRYGGEFLRLGLGLVKVLPLELLAIAVPITIGAAGLQLINLLDAATVNWRMVVAAEKTNPEALNVMGRLLAIAAQDTSRTATVTLAEHASSIGKGIYSFAQTIFNLPTAFIPCITAAIIPAITSHLTLQDAKGVRMVQDSSLRLMSLIAMPCTVGLLVLAEPIMALLGGYSGEKLGIAAWLLALLAPTVLINSITTMTTAIMQAHNHMVLPVINTLIGGLAKLGVNFILVGNPDITIVGAPIGTFVCFLVIMLLNLIAMRRVLDEPPKLLPRIWKTGVAALVMGVGAYVSYSLLGKAIASTALCCLGAIAVAVVIYVLLVIALKAITYEDCLLLPKGEKFAKIRRLQ